MNYRIFTVIILANLIPAAYAIDKGMPHSTPLRPLSNNLSSNEIAADPYQYCFKNATWIVPPQTLRAYLYDNGLTTAVVDQTVWVTPNYDQGYFSGESYTAIDNNLLSQRHIIGSVTSEGKVYITFYSGSSSSTDLVTGIGTLNIKSSGQCSFTMQMNSGQNGVSGLIHWSYMIPVSPGDYFYNNLPGTQDSVPQFIARF